MTDEIPTLESSLLDLPRQDWLAAVETILDEDGYVEDLGKRHHAIFLERGTTLLVTFETLQGIQALSETGQPLGWDMVKDHGWSHLCLASNGDTWFRDPAVYGYVDRLIDDGFFDDFDQVVFYGAGPCGYAAAAYSVAAPGAKVLVIQPQATLDPRVTEWDDRFADMRMLDFTSRYGFAPDMLDAADEAFVVYDPRETLDAMHAALFTRPNVTKLRMRFMGDALQTDLLEMNCWTELLASVGEGRCTPLSFAKLYRARRDHRSYLRNLLDAVHRVERYPLVEMVCTNVTNRMRAPRFSMILRKVRKRLETEQEDA